MLSYQIKTIFLGARREAAVVAAVATWVGRSWVVVAEVEIWCNPFLFQHLLSLPRPLPPPVKCIIQQEEPEEEQQQKQEQRGEGARMRG